MLSFGCFEKESGLFGKSNMKRKETVCSLENIFCIGDEVLYVAYCLHLDGIRVFSVPSRRLINSRGRNSKCGPCIALEEMGIARAGLSGLGGCSFTALGKQMY